MGKKKGIANFFYLPFFFIFNLVYSASVDEFETLINFKVKHVEHITNNDISTICTLGNKVNISSGITRRPLAVLIGRMQVKGIPVSWLDWFKRTYKGDSIGYKDFAAAIFYPYEVLENTHKTHLSHMNYAFKASVMYSSSLDHNGTGRKFFNSFGKDTALSITSDATCSVMLDIGFIARNSSFMDKVIAYDKIAPGVLNRLTPMILKDGTPTQVLNLGLIFNQLGQDKKSLECFNRAIEIGSQRAYIEKGNLLLKNNFSEGVDFFATQLGAYGHWKIAQCYRYGINTSRNPAEANKFYLQAVATNNHNYPEILYDAADFATEYAYAQLDYASNNSNTEDDDHALTVDSATTTFKRIIHSTIERLQIAGSFHLGLSYLKAAEISLEVAKRFPDVLVVSLSFSSDSIRSNTKKAFMEGQVAKSDSMLGKINMVDDMQMVVMRGYVENIDRYLGS